MLVRFIKRLWLYPKVAAFTIYTLTFNAFQSNSPVADCAFEPIIWLVDHFAGILGRALVALVILLISGIMLVFYTYVMPIVLEYDSKILSICHLICGHWLLLNVSFHYYKAVSTSPGYSPAGKQVLASNNIQICTKCIQVKPPRTHHCSVCNKCILKMDHHCPWINNCVGHFNHRYFFLFCVYVCLGTLYVSLTLLPNFLNHINFFSKNILKDYFNTDVSVPPTMGFHKYFRRHEHHGLNIKENKESIQNVIIIEFMLCLCVAIAVGALALWHVMMISRGETSIEVYINRSKRKKMKKEGHQFVNPYNYGIINNWKMLLGLGRRRGIWSVLMPSSHQPQGDGITWPVRSQETHADSGKEKVAFMA